MPKEKIKNQIYLRPSKHTITEVPPPRVPTSDSYGEAGGMYPKTNLQSPITLTADICLCIRGSDICAGSAAQYITRHHRAAPCEIIIIEVYQHYCSKGLKIN